MRAALTVAETAEALGTSPQTVRTLLRKGELRGDKREWGSRYVWEVSHEAVDEFIAEFGRLDGRRRPPRRAPTEESEDGGADGGALGTTPEAPDSSASTSTESAPSESPAPDSVDEPERPDRRLFVLRPRGRATVVVFIVGLPLLLAYAVARVYPGALWFDELGQLDVFQRTISAKADFYVQVAGNVAIFIGVNLALALKGTRFLRKLAGILTVFATSLVTASLFASAAQEHWQTYLLWRHRQPFGVVDPIHGKDVGFFVFTLPFEHLVSGLLLWLVTVTTAYVVLVHRARGHLGLRPAHASFAAQLHLASLAAAFLVAIAWRLRLEQYRLQLGQPSAQDSHSFAGAGYVDINIRYPGLTALMVLAVVLAVGCVVAPFVARSGHTRRALVLVGLPGALFLAAIPLVVVVVPALVQRYVVDPNPLLSEQPYVERSIAGTRAGLGLDTIDVEPYVPTGLTAADFPSVSERLARVPVWDSWVLGARMRQLVNETPYFKPDEPTLDIVRVDGERRPTVVSVRELDLSPVREEARTWINDRLAYTHGRGVIRFSGTDTGPGRAPRVLDAGLGLREPRIYFGNLPEESTGLEEEPAIFTPTTNERIAESPWVLANTRRPEVDSSASDASGEPYHYDGTGGIALSSLTRRAVFALALGSKELLLSDDITPESRILLHRDVSDRLHALAPFIQWDSRAVPLTANGRVVFVVDGYTTSQNYPSSELVDLGGTKVNYARASVRASVDAFSGRVDIYLADDTDPVALAWAEIYPTMFRPQDEMPAQLRNRLGYPVDLFDAQATAYERFHTTRPDVFVSDSDAWSRPIALSGPIEVASDVDFDEDDEDNLRLTLEPSYIFTSPPGQERTRLVLRTYFSPRGGQHIVGTLNGWIDEQGRARLGALDFPREPITLGPAQVSRLVFATARVRNLLGLRNLEIRDLDKSSLDSVLLGRPHILTLPGGVIQIQSLYEGSRGPGAARLLGVTAFLNGRAGLGPDIESAVRQALNEPPVVQVLPVTEPVVVDRPARLAFRVHNAKREVVTITSASGRHREVVRIPSGRATVTWRPKESGVARVRVLVAGLDGTSVSDSTTLRVLDTPPTLRFVDPPRRAIAGRPLRVTFRVKDALEESVKVSTRAGIVFTRDFEIRKGTGVVTWIPEQPGSALMQFRTRGQQGQTVTKRLRFEVEPRETATPPTVTLVRVPETVTVGRPATFAFRASDCRAAFAQLESPDGSVRNWRYPCPADPARVTWTPMDPGRHEFTAIAAGDGTTSRLTVRVNVEDPE